MNCHSHQTIRRTLLTFLLSCTLLLPQAGTAHAAAADPFPFVLLTCYQKSIPIDGQFFLTAITSNGKLPTFRSSKSSIAGVNTYGLVTGKKSGTCIITAKIKNAEASCRVTVEPSTVTLSKSSATLPPAMRSNGNPRPPPLQAWMKTGLSPRKNAAARSSVPPPTA